MSDLADRCNVSSFMNCSMGYVKFEESKLRAEALDFFVIITQGSIGADR